MFELLFILCYGFVILSITWIIVLPKSNIEKKNIWLVEKLEELNKIYKSKEKYKKAIIYDNETITIVNKYSQSVKTINELIEKKKKDEIMYNNFTEIYNKQKTEILTLVEKDKKLQRYTNKEIKRMERNDNDK